MIAILFINMSQRMTWKSKYLLYVFLLVVIGDHHVWATGLQVNLVGLKDKKKKKKLNFLLICNNISILKLKWGFNWLKVTASMPAHLPKIVLINAKPQVQFSGIILQNPLQRIVVLTVLLDTKKIKEFIGLHLWERRVWLHQCETVPKKAKQKYMYLF